MKAMPGDLTFETFETNFRVIILYLGLKSVPRINSIGALFKGAAPAML